MFIMFMARIEKHAPLYYPAFKPNLRRRVCAGEEAYCLMQCPTVDRHGFVIGWRLNYPLFSLQDFDRRFAMIEVASQGRIPCLFMLEQLVRNLYA